jgi:hypothetical protein
MTELFVAPAQKIARARRHITEASAECASFFARKPYAVIVESALPGANAADFRVWRIHVREPLPDHLSSVIGDAVHNLRSSLDLLACDLVHHNNGNVSGVYFPFANSEAGMEKAIKDKNMRRASPAVVALLRFMKPYRGGNADLRALHDLDIHDKHKGPIAIVSAVTTPLLQAAPIVGPDKIPRIPAWTSALADGHILLMVPPFLSPPIGTELPSNFRLVLPEGTPFAGHDVIPTLHRLAQHVASTLEAFRTLCLGDKSSRTT